jgi:hypothetical protein
MDGIIQALQGFFTNPGGGANLGNILKTGAIGGGAGFDLLSDIRNLQQINRLRDYQNNPGKAAAWINGATQPLSLALKQGVGNATQGYLAERGLATSPSIAAATEAQAVAPYIQHNQDEATQAFLAMLNPQKYPQIDLGGLMKLLKPTPGFGSGGGGGASGSFPTDLLPASQDSPDMGNYLDSPSFDLGGGGVSA